MRLKALLIITILFVLLSKARAQEHITVIDTIEINAQTRQALQRLAGLLNFLATPDIPKTAISAAIDSSIHSKDKFFFDNTVSIQDDIDPQTELTNTHPAIVVKYLDDFDLRYAKSAGSVNFVITKISNVKKAEYLYVRVKYDSYFASYYKLSKLKYAVKQREAEIRLERGRGDNWNAYIMAVRFYNPALSIDSADNNVPIQMVVDSAAIKRRKHTIDSTLKIENTFNTYKHYADSLKNAGKYKLAIEMLNAALLIKPYSYDIITEKIFLDEKIEQASYAYKKRMGDDARANHRYDQALRFYLRADSVRAGTDASLQPDIIGLREKISIIHSPSVNFQYRKYHEVITECTSALNSLDSKYTPKDFPELFYLRAKACLKLLEIEPITDQRLDSIKNDLNMAIEGFPNYTKALLDHADFSENRLHSLVKAINDYGLLITFTSDKVPEKPRYYAKKARLEDMEKSFPDSAVLDYTRAIILNPKADTFYSDRGELLYRLNRFKDARKSLDTAILIDSNNFDAHYRRGLNYVALLNNKAAGADFKLAENLKHAKFEKVDSISDSFFKQGQEFFKNNNYILADSTYNEALKINECNVDALYGQAEIHFINAEKINEKSGPADAKENYLKSIDLNNKATNCDPKCFRAYYMEGLAQNKVGEHEAAAMTFAGAISSNPFDYQVLIERGNTFFGLKKFEEAIKDYSATLQLLSANDNSTSKDTIKDNKIREANINLLLGEALYYNAYIYNKSSYDDARETLTKAIKLNEDNAEANYYMGLTYYAESDVPAAKNDYFSKANSYLDEAIDKNGTDYRYFYQRARTHDKRKKFADAIKDYTKVLDLDKLNLGKDTRYLRGLSYFRKKLTKEALDDFKLYKSDPNAETDTSFYADYSFVLLCSNQDLLAFNTLSKVMGAGPYHPKVSFALACYYYAKDDQLKSTASAQLKLADDLLEKAFASKKLSKDDLKFMKDVFIKRLNPNNGSYERLDKSFAALIKDYHNF